MKLDLSIYRTYNNDISEKSDRELEKHFHSYGKFERRIFARCHNTVERFAMRWCRGSGLEIGAGRSPVKLFGDAQSVQADLEGSEYFGNSNFITYSLNEEVPSELCEKFDFVIASHVLEHVDSLILSIRRLRQTVKIGGTIYFIVPDKTQLDDSNWMPDFDMEHHLKEEKSQRLHEKLHDGLILARLKQTAHNLEGMSDSKLLAGQTEVKNIREIIKNDSLEDRRFGFHQHTYDYNDWIKIIFEIIEHIGGLKFCEVGYGHERKDCHFVYEKC